MFGIIVSAFMLAFGIFLKLTKNPGFVRNKKFAWIFIGIGLVSLIFKILNYK
ncbi:hypothetical protein SAMN05421856_101465 [Chryseobacterium taichungense]|uniref:Uncharacterized protein n=1 Tax=Chryseobacterium taichungense TaxID=295069 RepID=A0A1H7W4M5_9FLAO|nr:hypothetical protein SAMN05421856_101465 [Chryseobacterium taichungense]